MKKHTLLSLMIGVALLAAAGTGTAKNIRSATGKIDERAEKQLHRMSDFLAGLQSFRVEVTATDEVVLDTGQKVQFVSRSRVAVKRPNMMRSDRIGPIADMVFRYDGKEISLYGKKTNYYATAPAPPTLDAMIDKVRTEYGIEAPAADLLYSKPYDILTEDVVSGVYIGLEPLGEEQAHHLAFRGNETDWQIWIRDGAEPLPLRYVITSKKEKAQPQFVAELGNWEPRANLTAEQFTFTPPAGAQRIQILERGRVPAKGRQLQQQTQPQTQPEMQPETQPQKQPKPHQEMNILGSGGAAAAMAPGVAPVIGRPATPVSYAGVARRSVRRGAYYSAGAYAGAAAASTYTTTLPAGCSPGMNCGGTTYAPYYEGDTIVYVQQ
jgi:hypothetical protein